MGNICWKILNTTWECSRIDNQKITWGNGNVVYTIMNIDNWYYTTNKVLEMAINNCVFIDVNFNLKSCNLSYH
jgi:hypothetical protein